MKINTRDMILVSLFAALMAVGAMLKILFPVIPFSFQPFFCAFAGILLGSKLGALSQIVYVLLGLAGAPIFTQGGGILYIFKPSFGFLLGFIAGAYVIGKLSEVLGEMSLKNALISVLAGLAVINAIGLPYMYLILKLYMNKADMTVQKVLTLGFYPFIAKDAILFVLVALVATSVVPVLKRSGLIGKRAA